MSGRSTQAISPFNRSLSLRLHQRVCQILHQHTHYVPTANPCKQSIYICFHPEFLDPMLQVYVSVKTFQITELLCQKHFFSFVYKALSPWSPNPHNSCNSFFHTCVFFTNTTLSAPFKAVSISPCHPGPR